MTKKKKDSVKKTTNKTFKAALANAQSRFGDQIVDVSRSKHTTYVGGIPVSTEYAVLARPAQVPILDPVSDPSPPPMDPVVEADTTEEDPPRPRTQVCVCVAF